MKKNCVSILCGFLSLFVTFSLPSVALSQSVEKVKFAKQLVEGAKLSEAATLGMRLSVKRAVSEGKASQKFLDCVSAVEPQIFSKAIENLYADLLSLTELKEALKFYQTSSGQKYAMYSLWGTEKYAGFEPSSPPVRVTSEEKSMIDSFVSSEVGKKLTSTSSELASATKQTVAQIIQPTLKECELTLTKK